MLFYLHLMLYITSCFLLSLILYLISTLSIKFNLNNKKMYSFECGFDPMNTPRNPFSIQFFKILLIFLLFDMEIILALPLIFFMNFMILKYLSIFLFILVIIIGLLFEWKEGSLEWLN